MGVWSLKVLERRVNQVIIVMRQCTVHLVVIGISSDDFVNRFIG